jgi:hypothetical protein
VLLNAIVSHAILRMFKMKSDVYKTAIMYTVVVIYTPITTLIGVPLYYGFYETMHEVKATSSTMTEFFQNLASKGVLGSVEVFDLYHFVLYPTAFIGTVSLAGYAECIAQYYNNPRHKTYVSVGVAAFLLSELYRPIAHQFQWLTLYSFMQ